MKRGLAIALSVAVLFVSIPAHTRPFPMRFGGFSRGGDAIIPTQTQTIANTSASPIGPMPYTGGMGFARGDIPSCLTGNYPIIKDHLGNTLVSQLDDVSKWDDGSCRHVAYSVFMPPMAAGGTEQLQFVGKSGAYTAGTDQRSTADITAHNYQMQFTETRPCAFVFPTCQFETNIFGSGAFTASLNTMISDGIIEVVATGPVRKSLVIHGAALDTAPKVTTLGATITNTVTGSILVGSTVGFPATGTFIAKIGGESVLAKTVDGTHINITQRGGVGSTPASHNSGVNITLVGHFWLRWYVDLYSSPGNSANLYGISHMPMIMLPWMNIVGPDGLMYKAALKDGNTTVRDWTETFTVAQSTAVNITTGVIDFGSNDLQRSECVKLSSTGTLPAPLVAERPYWVMPVTRTDTFQSTTYKLADHATAATGFPIPTVTLTSTGTGNMTISRVMCHAYREAWYSTADDAANPNWTVTRPPLKPKLTIPERTYFEVAGLMPPYDLQTVTASDFIWDLNNNNYPDSKIYRPGVAIATTNAIGAGGAPNQVGPLAAWDAVDWYQQSVGSWNVAQSAGLGFMHIPWQALLNEQTGRMPVFNNGPDDTGVQYAGLGSFFPDVDMYNVFANGLTLPPGNLNNNALEKGVFRQGPGNGPSDHKAFAPYYEWLLTGYRPYLDALRLGANAGIVTVSRGNGGLGNRGARINNTGRAWSVKFFGSDARSAGGTIKQLAGATAMGAPSVEMTYLDDVLRGHFDFFNTIHAPGFQDPGQDVIGAMDFGGTGGDGLTSRWGWWGYLWTRSLRPEINTDISMLYMKNSGVPRWDGTWISPYYASVEYWNNTALPYDHPLDNNSGLGDWKTHAAPSWDDVGVTALGDTQSRLSFTGGGATGGKIIIGSPVTLLQTNDKIRIVTPLAGLDAGAAYKTDPNAQYTGPPEFAPKQVTNACGGAEQGGWFYFINPVTPVSTSANITATFDGLACRPGGPAIAVTSTNRLTLNTYVIRPQANPLTGQVDGRTSSTEGSYSSLDRVYLCWGKALGLSGFDAAIAENTRRFKPKTGVYSNQGIRYAFACSGLLVQ